MTHVRTPTTAGTFGGATTLGDRGASYLRTVVPVVWGSLVAQLLAWATPHLPGQVAATLADWLSGESGVALVTAAVIAAWYVLWRRAEPVLPDWITRLVLGSAAAPIYARVDDGSTASTDLPPATPST